jgi:hypothetical protein
VCTPLLHRIRLDDAFPESSDAPPGRVVSLPHLKYLTIIANPAHTILPDRLSIPTGASMSREFDFDDDESPNYTHHSWPLENLENLSHMTSEV